MFHSRFLKSEKPLLACNVAGNIPLCLGIRRELATEVERRVLSNNLAIHSFVEQSDAEMLNDDELRAQGVDLAMFANINTLQDWERITRRP
jgi:molybdopterin-guanine dinucleotide biosynthesis protein A